MLKSDTKKTYKLRSQCHKAMDAVFEGYSKSTRYLWLKERGYKQHMSEMTSVELECLKVDLMTADENDFNIHNKSRKRKR